MGYRLLKMKVLNVISEFCGYVFMPQKSEIMVKPNIWN